VITGPAGIGKTALALRWLRRHGPYPHGCLHAGLGTGTEPVQDVLGRWLRAAGMPQEWIPQAGPARTGLWRSVTARRRLAILIDDAPSAAAIGALLPGPGPSVAIATTSLEMPAAAGDGARFLHLKPLPHAASVRMLEQVTGPRTAAAAAAELRNLADLCGGVPLALRCAAGLLTLSPQQDATEAAAALSGALGRLGTGHPGDAIIRAIISVSYAALSPPAARAYRLLSLHPGPDFGSGLAAAALGTTQADARDAIAVLRRAGLLEQVRHDRHRFPATIWEHARQVTRQAEPGPAQLAAEARIIGWHLRNAASAGSRMRMPASAAQPAAAGLPCGDREPGPAAQALAWLEEERASLRATVLLAARRGLPAAWQLADALWPLWQHRGHSGEQLRTSRAGLDAARECGDAAGQARMLDLIGTALHQQGQLAEAARALAQARQAWHALGDQRRLAASARRLGEVAAARGCHQAAIALHRQALACCQQGGDVSGTALAQVGLGRALAADGQAGEAEALLRDAIRALSGGPDAYSLARARAALASVLPGRPAAAVRLLEAALAAMEELGALPAQAEILQSLAEAACRAGQPDRACSCYRRALAILPARHPRAEAIQAAMTHLASPGHAA
jgi:tetratricopeptide (TPR) repeat protein